MGSEAQIMTRIWKKEIRAGQHKQCTRCGCASTYQDWGGVYYLHLIRTYKYTWEVGAPYHEVVCPSCQQVFLMHECGAPSEDEMPCMHGEGSCYGCKYGNVDDSAEDYPEHYEDDPVPYNGPIGLKEE